MCIPRGIQEGITLVVQGHQIPADRDALATTSNFFRVRFCYDNINLIFILIKYIYINIYLLFLCALLQSIAQLNPLTPNRNYLLISLLGDFYIRKKHCTV